MNTVEKGDIFESKSLNIIKSLIEEEIIYLPKDHVQIFQKKKYYSPDRKKDIIFDLTIEVWPPGADRYFMIYIIECKDYSKRVPISKIEDFHSKIQQVSGVNVKGIFISNSPLQEAAYNFAESKRMMLIQGDTPENAKIVLYKKSKTVEAYRIPFVLESLNENLIEEGVLITEKIIDKKFLNAFSEITPNISYNIDKLSKEDIEKIAEDELNLFNNKILENAEGIEIKELEKYLITNYNISITDLPRNSDLLGSCDIDKREISINSKIKNTQRHLFILCHEFGHFLLHQKLMIDQITYDSFLDSNYSFRTGKHQLDNPKHWIEWQANYFAACFILNKTSLLARIFECQNKLGLNKDAIVLTDSYNSRKSFYNILDRLVIRFNTSKTTLIYRMKELNFLKEKFVTKSVGELINDYIENYYT